MRRASSASHGRLTARGQATSSDDATPSGGRTTLAENDVELEVEDQSGDGRSVAVEDVLLRGTDGFVAIYTRDGRLLGAAAVGDRTLTVDLGEPITATGEYRAVLFADDGDDGFDPATDLRVAERDDDSDDDGDDLVDDDFDYTVR